MQFQRINYPDKQIESMFVSYCLKSKPYDFCNMPSRSMSVFKIKEYMNFLFKMCKIYLGTFQGQIKLFIAISEIKDEANIEFVFGNPFGFMKNLEYFRKFYQDVNPKIQTFSAQIKRKHKLNSFLKFIQTKDQNMQIFLDKQEIVVLWNT